MKKLALLIVCLFCFTSTSMAAPAAPQMSYTLNGLNLTIDWSTVPDAIQYTLYYAGYPYNTGDTIYSMNNGNSTTFSIDLWDGAAYYIATSAGNAQGNSGYSNIEYFIIKDHELAWETRESMGSARTQFAGGVINDKVYSFGGYDENEALLNSLEIYNPETDSWASGASNNQSVADLSGIVHNDKLYVFGATGEGCSTTNFSEEYDPGLDQWTLLASKTTTASGSPAVAYDNKIYLFGGWEENRCNDTGKTLKKNVEVYNPSTDSWQSGTPMPRALEGTAVAVYGDRAYVMGGVDAQGNYATDIIAYDFASESWIESGLGSLNAPRLFPSSTAAPVIEDTILLVGGWVEDNSAARSATVGNLVASDRVEFYSPLSQTVTVGDPLPEATAGHLPVVIGGDLFVIGGQANEGATAMAWQADVIIENEGNTPYLETDNDGDGYTENQGDCNDNNSAINPVAEEICGDDIDQDCSGDDETCPSGSIVGAWRTTGEQDDFLAFNFYDDGTYTHMEVDFSDQNEISGMEWGTYSIDENTGQMTVTQTFDNNGGTGLTDFVGVPNLYVGVEGNILTLSFDDSGDGTIDGSMEFQRQ